MNNIYIKKYLKYKKKYLNLKGGTLLRTERPLDNLSNTFIQVTIHGKTDSNKDNVFKIPENILLSMIDCCGSTAMQTINYWFDPFKENYNIMSKRNFAMQILNGQINSSKTIHNIITPGSNICDLYLSKTLNDFTSGITYKQFQENITDSYHLQLYKTEQHVLEQMKFLINYVLKQNSINYDIKQCTYIGLNDYLITQQDNYHNFNSSLLELTNPHDNVLLEEIRSYLKKTTPTRKSIFEMLHQNIYFKIFMCKIGDSTNHFEGMINFFNFIYTKKDVEKISVPEIEINEKLIVSLFFFIIFIFRINDIRYTKPVETGGGGAAGAEAETEGIKLSVMLEELSNKFKKLEESFKPTLYYVQLVSCQGFENGFCDRGFCYNKIIHNDYDDIMNTIKDRLSIDFNPILLFKEVKNYLEILAQKIFNDGPYKGKITKVKQMELLHFYITFISFSTETNIGNLTSDTKTFKTDEEIRNIYDVTIVHNFYRTNIISYMLYVNNDYFLTFQEDWNMQDIPDYFKLDPKKPIYMDLISKYDVLKYIFSHSSLKFNNSMYTNYSYKLFLQVVTTTNPLQLAEKYNTYSFKDDDNQLIDAVLTTYSNKFIIINDKTLEEYIPDEVNKVILLNSLITIYGNELLTVIKDKTITFPDLDTEWG
uniref:Uncharacterized protein n=1 Tax=viral metagenome TaxID=1070528 RepID=A0A6C0J628_9ZZZZ